MIDLDKYATSVRDAQRRRSSAVWIWMALLAGWLVISAWQRDALDLRFGDAGRMAVIGLPTLAIVVGGMIGISKLASFPRLKCPSCSRSPEWFTGRIDMAWAIATRNCPHCAKQILDGTMSAVHTARVQVAPPVRSSAIRPRRPGPSLEDRSAAATAAGFRSLFAVSAIIGSYLVLAAVTIVLCWLFRAQITKFLGEFGVKLLLGLGLAVLPLLIAFGVVVWWSRGMKSDRRLACPHCGKEGLCTIALRLTGNCHHCGGPLVDFEAGSRSHDRGVPQGSTFFPLSRIVAEVASRKTATYWFYAGVFVSLIPFALFKLQAESMQTRAANGPLLTLAAGARWVWLGGAIAGGFWAVSRLERKASRCPHCRLPFGETAHVAIATRHCGNCGGRVLSEG